MFGVYINTNVRQVVRAAENTLSTETCVSKGLYGFLPTKIAGFESQAKLAPIMRWSCFGCVFTSISVLTLLVTFCGAGPACLAEDLKPAEADITRATASLLERSQFSQHSLDDSLASQFLDRYLDTLDGAHILFLQCDLNEFARFCPGLAQRTLGEGDTRPAHIIYMRYLKRLAQEADFAANLLRADKFDFKGHDSWQTDRRVRATWSRPRLSGGRRCGRIICGRNSPALRM